MTQLLLVRHGHPDIQPGVPSKEWALSEKGQQQSLAAAEQLRIYCPEAVITSEEPKAAETGRVIAEALDLPCHRAPGLHENDRTDVPYFADLADLETGIKTFFANSGQRVFGGESADEARQRFIAAVQSVLEPHPTQTVAIVAHGTVNTLFTEAFNPVDAFDLWKTWPLAGFAVFSRPEFGLLKPPSEVKR